MDRRPVVLYARRWSWRCWRVKRLLARGGYQFEVVSTTAGGLRAAPKQRTRNACRDAPPYVLVDRRSVGGFGDIVALHRSGDLERLVRGEV